MSKFELPTTMDAIFKNTLNIVYVYKATLTPSGIFFEIPTPEMKGRLLKEFST